MMRDMRKVVFASLIIGALLAATSHLPSASQAPAVIELDNLGDIYEPVIFDHVMHMDVASCATCHHHTNDMPAEDEKCVQCHSGSCSSCAVACKDCHSVCPGCADKVETSQETPLYHIDTAGLSRAYHIMCLGCHQEMGAASGCEDCHMKKEDSTCK